MALLRVEAPRPGVRTLSASADVQTGAEVAFALLCEVEKWPVWLPFLRSAEIASGSISQTGCEVLLRSAIPGEAEQLYEVDRFVTNNQLSLVGAYSTRRRIDLRLERKMTRCKLSVALEYPAYGGKIAVLYDAVRAGRKLATQLDEAVLHFKHLAEYNHNAKDELLADF